MDTWSLRKVVLTVTQRWPLPVAAFIVGALLGWVLAVFWPAPYRAASEIYIGLDPYRAVDDRYVAAYAGDEFRNADDYKYWQMEQLNALAVSAEYLQETLARLKTLDPSWQAETIERLRSRLRLSWRNAGSWRLTATGDSPQLASQAVSTWREVVREKSRAAITASQALFLLDLQQQAVIVEQLNTHLSQELRSQTRLALANWSEANRLVQPAESLPALERERLLNLAAQAAGPAGNWQLLLASAPLADAARQEYTAWAQQLIFTIDDDVLLAAARLERLEAERASLEAQWRAAYQAGHGLAATLLVEQLDETAPAIQKLRPTSQAALVGGFLGVLLFGFWVIARAAWQK